MFISAKLPCAICSRFSYIATLHHIYTSSSILLKGYCWTKFCLGIKFGSQTILNSSLGVFLFSRKWQILIRVYFENLLSTPPPPPPPRTDLTCFLERDMQLGSGKYVPFQDFRDSVSLVYWVQIVQKKGRKS